MQSTTNVRAQLTGALLTLMTRCSFDSITVTEIVKEAKVSRASFYRNFLDKEDILRQHMVNLIQTWSDEFESGSRLTLQESLLNHYYTHRSFYELLYRCGLSHLLLENIKVVCGAKPEQDNATAYNFAWFAGGLFGCIDEWIIRGMQETPEQMSLLPGLRQQ